MDVAGPGAFGSRDELLQQAWRRRGRGSCSSCLAGAKR